MLFNSLVFVLFAAVFFAGWPIARRGNRARWAYIVAASALFYGWWDARFLVLILGSGLIDYGAALAMERWPRHRRALLIASMSGNLGSLAVFKYAGFALRNLEWATGSLGLDWSAPELDIILPVGISFYTFQSMSYTIDVYRGELKPTRSLLHFFAYLALFPQLVAGPIVRAADLLPQMESGRRATSQERWDGLVLVAQGFFMKVVVADNLAPSVDSAFRATTGGPTGAGWWVIMLMFAFQIFCDFAGYSAIAVGLAKWMGYSFPHNFDHPYVSTSLREFWTRWHISLSTWFRDYLYVPLGGSRGGRLRSHVNLWATMVTSGLWHGAAWTYVIWGAIHSLFLSIERETRWSQALSAHRPGRIIAAGIVLAQVLVAWVFFRATSVQQAALICRELVRPVFSLGSGFAAAGGGRALFFLAIAIAWELAVFATQKLELRPQLPSPVRSAGAVSLVALMLVASIYLRGPGAAFIYFQF